METVYRGLYFEDFEIGREFRSPGRTVTEADTVLFAGLSGDFNPLHMNESFAAQSPYGRRMAHGALVQSLMTGMIAQLGIFEGTTVALRRLDSTFKNPVFFGDTLVATIQVDDRKELRGRPQGIVTFRTRMINDDEKTVAEGKWILLLQRRGS